MTQRFGKSRMVPKEDWEWSDWRHYENDLTYTSWKCAQRGKEVHKLHYGD